MMRFDTYGHSAHGSQSLSGLIPGGGRQGFSTPHQNQVPSFGSSSSSSRHNHVNDKLRNVIHSRRALSHEPMFQPEDLFPKEVKFKLTPEEEEKRRIRREKNKLAASKCRTKKRELVNTTKMEYEKVSASNSHMEREIERLKNEKRSLMDALNKHSCSISSGHNSRQNNRYGNNSRNSKLRVDDDVSLRFNFKF